MKLAIIESPFAGDIEGNIQYARKAVKHALSLGYSPIASHLLFTQEGILDDAIPEERKKGIEAGLSWYKVADICLVYMDKGISEGMMQGINRAVHFGVDIKYFSLE